MIILIFFYIERNAVIIMAYKVPENIKFSLRERIFTTIGEMQLIYSDEILFEIEEAKYRAL